MLLRAGLWLLAVVDAAVGVVATAAPRSFYDLAPWVALSPPYSEHLVRDYGAMNLALAWVVAVAAGTMHRLLVRTALVALLLFALPHLLFHATHAEHLPAPSAAAELVALAVAALLPAALLALATRRAPRPPSGA